MVDFIDQRVGSSTACVLHTAINGSSVTLLLFSHRSFFLFFYLRMCLQSVLRMKSLLNEGIFFIFFSWLFHLFYLFGACVL